MKSNKHFSFCRFLNRSVALNYKRIYDNLIERAKKRKLSEKKYVEQHHIIPKSFFSSLKEANQSYNLVLLLPEEHWIAHLLLAKFTTGIEQEKMKQAILVMSGSNKKNRLKCTNKRYAKRKKSSAYRKRKKEVNKKDDKIKKEEKNNRKKYKNKRINNGSKKHLKGKIISEAKEVKNFFGKHLK